MIKRALIIIVALFSFVMQAQKPVGEWKLYPVFANSVTKMLETPEKVFYVSEGNLYSYDKNTDENYHYASVNKLNDNNVTDIYYNDVNKYVLVTYKNGNIDLVFDKGNVVNLPDIKDAVLTTSKTINDVSFYENKIYVATEFGIIIYNDQTYRVIESGIFSQNVSSILATNGYIIMCIGWDIYAAEVEGGHSTLDKFTKIYGTNAEEMEVVNDNKILFLTKGSSNYTLREVTTNFTAGVSKIIKSIVATSIQGPKYFNRDSQGGVYTTTTSQIIKYDTEGNQSIVDLPTSLQSKTLSYWNDMSSVWAADGTGIGNYDISGGNVTVLKDVFNPGGVTVKNVIFLNQGNSGKVYLANTGASKIYNVDRYIQSQVNCINEGEIENIVPKTFVRSNKNNPGSTKFFDSYNLCEDPTDPDAYYIGTYWEGLYKVKNNEAVKKYDWTNSTITMAYSNYACHVPALGFDRNNNLWVVQIVDAITKPVLHMITAANLQKEEVTASDWNGINLGDFKGDKDARILICKHSNMIFVSDGTWDSKLIAYDTKGTYDNVKDDKYLEWGKFIDQDGKVFDPSYITWLNEDADGRVWIGTDIGVVEIARPETALDGSMTINHLKVPRNDGTSLADYLLDAQFVTYIACDNSNRKWISTRGSGLYLVSESGDAILQHYTEDNSPLPSNTVCSVVCDSQSNTVYIGTDMGLVEFKSDSSPAEADFSNVYAYPNPVRPDYTGWITIKGLMENSLVKIADSLGNVFYTTRSEGGMVTWDGCNAAGQRVKSGVYYVFASHGGDGENTMGVVTKILVVN